VFFLVFIHSSSKVLEFINSCRDIFIEEDGEGEGKGKGKDEGDGEGI